MYRYVNLMASVVLLFSLLLLNIAETFGMYTNLTKDTSKDNNPVEPVSAMPRSLEPNLDKPYVDFLVTTFELLEYTGNHDSTIDAGEVWYPNISITNVGTTPLINISVYFYSDNPSIKFENSSLERHVYYGQLAVNETKSHLGLDAWRFKALKNNKPSYHVVVFHTEITDGFSFTDDLQTIQKVMHGNAPIFPIDPIIALTLLISIMCIVSCSLYVFKVRNKRNQQVKQHGFATYQQWQTAKSLGAKNTEELDQIQHGNFSSRDEWLEAKQHGFTTHQAWQAAQQAGVTDPEKLEELRQKELQDLTLQSTWLEAKQHGFSSYREWQTAKNLGVTDPEEFKQIQHGNFNSRKEWLEAKQQGFTTQENYQHYLNVQKTKKLLRKFRAGIPVSLQRIHDLSKINKSELELILQNIAKTTSLGEYLELEQVFVRAAAAADGTSLATPSDDVFFYKTKDKGQPKEKETCMVCSRVVKRTQKIVACPYCANVAHQKHLLEWIKQKGICPVCRETLTENDLIQYGKKQPS